MWLNPPTTLLSRNYHSHCTDEETEICQKSKKWSQFCFESKYSFHYTLLPQIMKEKREDRKASEIILVNLSLMQGPPRRTAHSVMGRLEKTFSDIIWLWPWLGWGTEFKNEGRAGPGPEDSLRQLEMPESQEWATQVEPYENLISQPSSLHPSVG